MMAHTFPRSPLLTPLVQGANIEITTCIFTFNDFANTSFLFAAILLLPRQERLYQLNGKTQRPFHDSQ